jgi:V-type H+-transporting ATPase subunit H
MSLAPSPEVPPLSKALFKDADPYRHVLPLLARSNNSEDPIPLLASTVLTKLISTARDESAATKRALPVLLTYLSDLTKNSDSGLQDIAVQSYSSLLFGHGPRLQFWGQRSETVSPLVDILRSAAGIDNNGTTAANLWSGNTSTRSTGFEGSLGGGVGLQLLYHVLLVMWQMSFESEEIGDDLNEYVTTSIHNSRNTVNRSNLVNMISFCSIHNCFACHRKKRLLG